MLCKAQSWYSRNWDVTMGLICVQRSAQWHLEGQQVTLGRACSSGVYLSRLAIAAMASSQASASAQRSLPVHGAPSKPTLQNPLSLLLLSMHQSMGI